MSGVLKYAYKKDLSDQAQDKVVYFTDISATQDIITFEVDEGNLWLRLEYTMFNYSIVAFKVRFLTADGTVTRSYMDSGIRPSISDGFKHYMVSDKETHVNIAAVQTGTDEVTQKLDQQHLEQNLDRRLERDLEDTLAHEERLAASVPTGIDDLEPADESESSNESESSDCYD